MGSPEAQLNLKKHGVSFEEAAEVFFDPFYQHGDASIRGEEREFILGYPTRERLLLVVHIKRADHIRIISARPVTREERKQYEEA